VEPEWYRSQSAAVDSWWGRVREPDWLVHDARTGLAGPALYQFGPGEHPREIRLSSAQIAQLYHKANIFHLAVPLLSSP